MATKLNWKDRVRNPDCELCPLHEGAEWVCLMGSGKKSAEVMICGEAPGAREDEEHRAFVGSAGKLLTELLEEAGLDRESCYITNAAKCRPPDNRAPTRKEIKTCGETYLVQELDAVRPKYTLALGNSSLQALTGRSGISKHRGKLHRSRLHDTPVFATYHPAAALRNPRLEPEIRADFQRFARIILGTDEVPKTKVRIIRTTKQLRWLLRQLNQAEVISYDIETTGLEEWRDGSRLVSIGFTWRVGEAAVVPLHHVSTPWANPDKVLRALKGPMERRECKYVAHNGKFDSRWLARKGIFVTQTFDTMLAAHLLDENRAKSLEVLSNLLLGAGKKDGGLDKSNLYNEPLKKVCIYNGYDTDLTFRIYMILREQLKEEPRLARVFQKLMMPASNSLTKVERVGINVDDDNLDAAWDLAEGNLKKLELFMAQHGGEGVNYNSPKQIAEWFFEDLGLPVLERTKTDAPSTNESVLQRLQKDHPAPKALLKWRKWNKRVNTYLKPWEEHRDPVGRIHPGYHLYGTVTGRLSSSGPNLQQVPRDPIMRGCLGAKHGWAFVEADYSQIELRIVAMLARERRMLRRFLAGEDIHLGTAVDIIGKRPGDVTSEERKRAKAVNFGFVYGMGAPKFVTYARDSYDVEVSREESEEVRRRFFETYPALIPWHDRQRRLAERYGRVYSPTGRIRHLPDVRSRDREVRAEALRQAINSPVQCFASDLMLLSLVRLDKLLPYHRARIVGSIHDALLFEVAREHLEETCRLIKAVMEDLTEVKRKFGVDITVPIEAEVKVGQYWGRCEPWKG